MFGTRDWVLNITEYLPASRVQVIFFEFNLFQMGFLVPFLFFFFRVAPYPEDGGVCRILGNISKMKGRTRLRLLSVEVQRHFRSSVATVVLSHGSNLKSPSTNLTKIRKSTQTPNKSSLQLQYKRRYNNKVTQTLKTLTKTQKSTNSRRVTI